MKQYLILLILLFVVSNNKILADNPRIIVNKYLSDPYVEKDTIKSFEMEPGKAFAMLQSIAVEGKVDSVFMINISNRPEEVKNQFTEDFTNLLGDENYELLQSVDQGDSSARLLIRKEDGLIRELFFFINREKISVGGIYIEGTMKDYNKNMMSISDKK